MSPCKNRRSPGLHPRTSAIMFRFDLTAHTNALDKVSYTDFTKVKFAPVSREEILENITKTLLWIADKCKKLELDRTV